MIVFLKHNRQEVIVLGKTALVTGSSRGIGAAAAIRLSQDGWDVLIHYHRSEEEALALAAQLGTRAIRADVRDPEQVESLFREAGHIDLLVCCAGISEYGLITDVTEPAWKSLIETNTGGVFRCCRAAVPWMVHCKKGNIILISSVWGRYGGSCEAAYSGSKAAVIGLTKALAKELGPSGIRVNCVAPGPILTDMLTGLSHVDLDELSERVPLGRIGTPEDVAELVAFLASERSSFITGQIIGCDGGFAM